MHNERGSIMLTVALTLPVLVGMLGLTADVGRMYVAKNELQAFADSAAIAASYDLDGTTQGLTNARSMAAAGPGSNKWDFASKTPAVQTSFAQTFTGTYSANPSSPAGYRFIKVIATGQVPVYFVLVLPHITSPQTITATAVAGQGSQTSLGEGLDPFAPDAHNPNDANFGFTVGLQYTLKWSPSGQRDKHFCGGDSGFTPGGGSSDRGMIDIGQGNGNSALHNAIVNNDYNLPQPLTIGSSLNMVQGNKDVPPALTERFNQDTDLTAATFSAYHGNGRRIMILPVSDNSSSGKVVGFGGFFLPLNACGNKNNSPCCAEYIGPVLKYGKKGAGLPGVYQVELFQ